MENKNGSGQSLIEFSFSIIVFMIILVGIFDFGRLFWTKIVLANAARVGVRYLSRHPDDLDAAVPPNYDETIAAAITDASNSSIALSSSNFDINCTHNVSGDLCLSGYPATVTIEIDQELGLLSIFSDNISLTESATMLIP